MGTYVQRRDAALAMDRAPEGEAKAPGSPLRAMGYQQQVAALAPGNQSYEAGTAKYAPIQFRGLGGGEKTEGDGAEGGKEGPASPPRIKGHFMKSGRDTIVFTKFGTSNGARDGQHFIAVVDGKEIPAVVGKAFLTRVTVRWEGLPDWVKEGKERPEDGPAPDKDAAKPADGGAADQPNRFIAKGHRDAVVVPDRPEPLGVVEVSQVPKAPAEGAYFEITVRVGVGKKVETHRLEVMGDREASRLPNTLSDALRAVVADRLSSVDVTRLNQRVLAQLKPKLPAAWFGK
ncbi:MAG: hypothetical protein H6745_08150 [Deltaproteobacteria bacterium]|nr:hypothetical protein [Deltaproteobacteria bacterium]